jgi:hypothetical protein
MIATHRRSRDHRPKWSRSRCGRSFRYSQASGSRAVVLGACAGPMAWRQSHLHSEAHADTIKKRERFPPRSSVHSALGYRSPKSSSNRSRRQVRPNLEVQRWCSLRTNRTTRGILQGFWGRRLKCRPLPQTLLLLEDAKTLLRKRKLCPKKLCHSKGSPQGVAAWYSLK